MDIGILHYKYNVLNDSVIWQKLYFDQDSIIRENTNIPTSLYMEQIAFIISPLKKKITGTSVTFNLNNLFGFDNTNNPITQLFADFQDGNGPQTVNLNASVSVNYPPVNSKYTLHFIAILSNGDTLTTFSEIEITASNQSKCVPAGQTSGWQWIGNDMTITAKIDFYDYDNNWGKNEGYVRIYFMQMIKLMATIGCANLF